MRRGFDQATSSSLSRATNTGAQGQSQSSTRTRRAQYERPSAAQISNETPPPQVMSARRKTEHQPPPSLDRAPSGPLPSQPERKSPSYLQGKNPYGQVLEKVEHPYRAPRDPVKIGPPSQVDASVGSRPRTDGSFKFKTRPAVEVTGPTLPVAATEELSLPIRQPPKPISVQDVKKFFESKASQPQYLPRAVAPTVKVSRYTVQDYLPKFAPIPLQPSTRPESRQTRQEEADLGSSSLSLDAKDSSEEPIYHRPVHMPKVVLKSAGVASVESSRSNPGLGADDFIDDISQPLNAESTNGDCQARILSHDGSNSTPSLSRRSTMHEPVSISNIGVQKDYHDIELPDHIDWRGAYGRRHTKDFGFPGARIKSHGPFTVYNAPQNSDPRSCHYTRLGRESPAHRPAGGKVATEVSDSSSSEAESNLKDRGDKTRLCHRLTEYPQAGECGDVFAKDLGHIIDAILEEHTNSLQGVINNIKQSQPSLVQLRHFSEELVHRCQIGGMCSAPKAAEKLNVGSSGQLKPTMNDSRSSLAESVRTVPDLLGLVNSAADNLGVDLDRRPSALDDQMFLDAPFEDEPRPSARSRRSNLYVGVEVESNKSDDERRALLSHNLDESDVATEDRVERSDDDAWLQNTRKQLTRLSEGRRQLMDELDVIADEIGTQLASTDQSVNTLDAIPGSSRNTSPNLSQPSTQFDDNVDRTLKEEIPTTTSQQTDEGPSNQSQVGNSEKSSTKESPSSPTRRVSDYPRHSCDFVTDFGQPVTKSKQAKPSKIALDAVGVLPIRTTVTESRLPVSVSRQASRQLGLPDVDSRGARLNEEPLAAATIGRRHTIASNERSPNTGWRVDWSDSDSEKVYDKTIQSDTIGLALLDEPLAVYDVYNGSPMHPLGQDSRKDDRGPNQDLQDNARRRSSLPLLARPSIALSRMPPFTNRDFQQTDMSKDICRVSDTRDLSEEIQPKTERPRVQHIVGTSCEHVGSSRREFETSVSPSSLLENTDDGDQPQDPPPPRHGATRFGSELVPPLRRVSTVVPQPDQLRRVSAAPGIDVYPQDLLAQNPKPVASVRPRLKQSNYPPEQQYPPSPGYPSRQTPTWTRPDTQNPPLKRKPRKATFFASKDDYFPKLVPIEQYHGPRRTWPKPAPVLEGSDSEIHQATIPLSKTSLAAGRRKASYDQRTSLSREIQADEPRQRSNRELGSGTRQLEPEHELLVFEEESLATLPGTDVPSRGPESYGEPSTSDEVSHEEVEFGPSSRRHIKGLQEDSLSSQTTQPRGEKDALSEPTREPKRPTDKKQDTRHEPSNIAKPATTKRQGATNAPRKPRWRRRKPRRNRADSGKARPEPVVEADSLDEDDSRPMYQDSGDKDYQIGIESTSN